jgi:carbohydrate esterase-like sialic acid-specific acetylesterase
MIPDTYQNAVDSGVYLRGVDSSDIGIKTRVAANEIVSPAVVMIIGQSNGGNHGETRHAAQGPVYNFNPFDGCCYRASDPLLGATGDGGSPWCLLGDAIIAKQFAPSILYLPLSVGGGTVAQWAPGGTYHHRMTYALGRLREKGFWPSHVFWHQGEADALYGTSAQDYTAAFSALFQSLRELGIAAPVYVAIASFFSIPEGYQSQQNVIRAAQRSLINPDIGILAGPDTDVIGDRYDGCHMGTLGLSQHAAAWEAVLTLSPTNR